MIDSVQYKGAKCVPCTFHDIGWTTTA